MPNYNFRKDLPIAKATEREVAGLLALRYDFTIVHFEDTSRYDFLLKIREREIKVEVKEDFTCEKTGNVGLEYACRGKPSGIAVSEADFYIYKLHTKDFGIQYILHPVHLLKRMIAEKQYFRIVNGGDKGSNSMNYLFKYKIFVEAGRILPLDKPKEV
jgi:hypothetical protein